jgi:hypothetical protein
VVLLNGLCHADEKCQLFPPLCGRYIPFLVSGGLEKG